MKTDAQVQQDVMAELKWEPAVTATRIGVAVNDGIVTLTGHVDSFTEKWEATRAAQRVTGVQGITTEIEVALPGESHRDDADIARTAENILQWVTYVPRESVKVSVENGWVTLTGELSWEYQKRAAERAVRHLMGVRGVSDQIAIKHAVFESDVQGDIKAALQRQANQDAHGISVMVDGDSVTLTGTVNSWWERDLARRSAWNAAGVHKVVDNIVVAR